MRRTCDRYLLAGEESVQTPKARTAAVLVERLHVEAALALLRRSPDDLREEMLMHGISENATTRSEEHAEKEEKEKEKE